MSSSSPRPSSTTLTLDGIAVTPHGQHHLILTLAGVARFYMGPDDATVTRRIEILTAALRNHIDTQHASFVVEWIQWSWESLLDELVAQLTTGLEQPGRRRVGYLRPIAIRRRCPTNLGQPKAVGHTETLGKPLVRDRDEVR